MIRTSSHRFPPARTAALCATAALLALAGCDARMAGTSVGTGNPTEIQVGFKDGSGSATLSGRVSVFAATQIPVEGYKPEPLLEYELNDASHADLKAADFAALPDSVWAKGSIENGIRSFNVVVTGATRGSVLAGFGFDKAKGRFVLRSEDQDAVWDDAGDLAAIKDSLRALVDLTGVVDTVNLNRYNDYHLFVYGTQYAAKVENGGFSLHGIPDGAYKAYLLALPQKDHQGSGMDSADIFSTSEILSATGGPLSRGEPYQRVKLPDSLLLH